MLSILRSIRDMGENMIELNQWADDFKPFPNPFRVNTDFDFGQGDCLFYLVDLNQLRNKTEVPEEHIWTILYDPETEDRLVLVNGYDTRPSLGFFVTKNRPRFNQAIFLA